MLKAGEVIITYVQAKTSNHRQGLSSGLLSERGLKINNDWQRWQSTFKMKKEEIILARC